MRLYSEREMVDPKTGEVIKLRIIGLKEEFKDSNFVKFFDVFTKRTITDRDIAGKAIVLLFYILDKLEYNQLEFYMSPTEACKDLHIVKDTYHRWMKTLIRKGIVERIGINRYKLNPECVYKGVAAKMIQRQIGREVA